MLKASATRANGTLLQNKSIQKYLHQQHFTLYAKRHYNLMSRRLYSYAYKIVIFGA